MARPQQFKIQVEDDRGIWSNVLGADGRVLVFSSEDEGRAELARRYPVMVQMEKFAGGKHTRVVRIFDDDED